MSNQHSTLTPARLRTPRSRRIAEVSWLAGLSAALIGLAVAMGGIPTTSRDFFIPGTQINKLQQRLQSINGCAACHGGYNEAHEPVASWAASMMGQAGRDPIFYACLAISNQDANFSGELCLRCHVPGGWLHGRAVDPTGAQLNEVDIQGVTCHFCHRMLDPEYHPGQSPPDDELLLTGISPPATSPHSGSFVVDPQDRRRGPFDISYIDPHPWLQSPFHRTARMCATCHDVSNPVYERQVDGSYALGAYDTPNISNNKYDQFPLERTYSEWSGSIFGQGPVNMQGRFGGNRTEVSICQDCHMPSTTGTGCNPEIGPITRDDLPRHFFNGANTWVLRSVRALYDDITTYLTQQSVEDSIARAQQMLRSASDLEVTQLGHYINARIINFSGHKLPTGYAEGRRMWINVKCFDSANNLIGEFGAYNPATGQLSQNDTKVYEAVQGLDAAAAAATGKPVGPGFHFAINNTYYKDNRIPPMGFTNAGFAAVQAAPVGATYSDGQFWDDTTFFYPDGTARAEVRVFHQVTTKEYIEFLRDNNTTNTAGQTAYDQWVAQGRSAPTEMDFQNIDLSACRGDVNLDGGVDGQDVEAFFNIFAEGLVAADFNDDGGVDGSDVEAFFNIWSMGC